MSPPLAESFAATIVGGVDFQESHRIVRLLTEQGRLSVFAPGARRSKRRFAGGLQPFTRITATVTRGQKRQGMPTLSEATIDKSRLSLRRDLAVVALASYFAELSDRVAPESEPCITQYNLLEHALDILESEPAGTALRRRFELRLAAELGYEPEVERCGVCGRTPEAPARLYFELNQGGLRCAEHRDYAPEIGPKTWAWLKQSMATPHLEPLPEFDADWERTAAERLSGTSTRFFAELLDRPLKSAALLSSVDLV